MAIQETGRATVPNYKLRPPTEEDVRGSLQRVFGDARSLQLWTEACQEAGASAGRVQPGAEFHDVLKRLATRGGAAATVVLSVEIRLKTHAHLAARAAASNSGAAR